MSGEGASRTSHSAPTRRTVHFLVPEGIDDPTRVSGGNIYDARVSEGLADFGWHVEQREVQPDAAAAALADVPDGGLVLIDGLVAGRSADAVVAEAVRLRAVVLAHMVSEAFPDADPLLVEGERRALGAVGLVVTTSHWTRSELVSRGIADAHRLRVATPGTDAAPAAVGTRRGGALLCVGVVAPHKGQDVLVEALAGLPARSGWTCTIAGSIDRESAFAQAVASRAEAAGLGDRVEIMGVLAGAALEAAYRDADLLIAPSRVESYGMAVAEALRRGIPVLASEVGGIVEAVAPSAGVVLVPPGDPVALGAALEHWLADRAFRAGLTRAARDGVAGLQDWRDTASDVALALEEAA